MKPSLVSTHHVKWLISVSLGYRDFLFFRLNPALRPKIGLGTAAYSQHAMTYNKNYIITSYSDFRLSQFSSEVTFSSVGVELLVVPQGSRGVFGVAVFDRRPLEVVIVVAQNQNGARRSSIWCKQSLILSQ